MRIIARNFRDKTGEIDIIAQDGETVVFVEVKTRRSDRYGSPEESVTVSKQKQIIRVAGSFLSKHALIDAPIRFDVIAIRMATEGPEINHIVAAFDAF